MKFASCVCVVLASFLLDCLGSSQLYSDCLRLPCASFKGCTLAICVLEDHWSDGAASDPDVNCGNWGTSANQCYLIHQHTHPRLKLSLALLVQIPWVWVCLQFPQLAGNCGVLLFCFQCKCDVIFLFSLDQSWTENRVIIFVFLMLFGTQVVNNVYCC